MRVPLPVPSLTRTRLFLVAAMIAVAAVFVAFAAPGTSASAAAPTAADSVAQAIQHGTVAADIASGRLSHATVEAAASTGLSVGGTHFDPWVDLSPAAAAKAADLASHDASVAQAAASLKASGALDPGVSDHWWNIFRNHEYYIPGYVVKTIVTVGAGTYLAAVCITLDLSKLSCAALGLVVAGAAEYIKDTGCGQGYYFDFPEVWKSHCAD